MVDKRGTRHDVLKVKDKKGEVKQSKRLWKDHFEGILNAGQPSKGGREASERKT